MKSLKIIALMLLAYVNYASASDKLNFNWGTAKAVVTEKINKGKGAITIRYEISLEKHKQGYVVKQTNVDILIPKTPPEKEAEKSRLLAAMSVPDLLVDRKGNPLDVLDLDGYINRVNNYFGGAKTSQLLQSPQMREILFVTAQKNWCLWVCNWTDVTVKEGTPKIETSTIEIAGMNIPQTTSTEIYKNWEGSKNVKLTLIASSGGEAAVKELTNFVQSFTQENNLTIKDDGNSDNDINNFSKGTTVIAIIDPATLKPISVISEELTEISTSSETKRTKEKHEYSFEWK